MRSYHIRGQARCLRYLQCEPNRIFLAVPIALNADTTSCNSKNHPMWLAAEVSYPAHSFTANSPEIVTPHSRSSRQKVVQSKRIAASLHRIPSLYSFKGYKGSRFPPFLVIKTRQGHCQIAIDFPETTQKYLTLLAPTAISIAHRVLT
jgi:hypothetical protein